VLMCRFYIDKTVWAQAQWLKSVIPATWEAEIGWSGRAPMTHACSPS
jgi:hypothetical protein